VLHSQAGEVDGVALPAHLSRRVAAGAFGAGHAQTPPAVPPESRRQDQSDVLRVYTELVQTDVMVFDKQGRFVNGLKREDFELRIDGKVKPIDFFEKITAGSINEESQMRLREVLQRRQIVSAPRARDPWIAAGQSTSM